MFILYKNVHEQQVKYQVSFRKTYDSHCCYRSYTIQCNCWCHCITCYDSMENKEDNSAKQVEESKDSANDDSVDDDKSDGVDDISKFRNDYCIDGKLTLDGKVVTMGTLKDSFPDLKFTGDACDPCDKDCQFEIISSSERLTAEENMRATDSNTQPVDHKEAIKKRE